MDPRAYRVANIYIESVRTSQTETTERDVQLPILDETKLKGVIDESLLTYYRSYIEQWLRNLSFEELLVLSNYVVDQFNESKEDQKALIEELSNLKNRFLRSIREVALSPNNSITDTILTYFKSNPTSDEDAVEEYVKKFLIDIKNRTKRQVKKWKDIV